jgi:uncharacterized protein (TIRG00374 family)
VDTRVEHTGDREKGRKLLAPLVWVGLVVSGLLTYLAVRDVRAGAVWVALKEADYPLLLPAAGALAAAVVVRAVRWRLLFRPTSRPPLSEALRALLVGCFFNSILPARAGELVRVFALNRRTGVSRAETLTTVFVERAYDVFSLFLLLLAAAPFLPHVPGLRTVGEVAAALALLVAAVAVVLTVFGERPARALLRPFARLPGMTTQQLGLAATNVVNGLSALRRGRTAFAAILATLCSWLLLAASTWFVFAAFHLGLGFAPAVLVVVATNLALTLPASPAGLGVFEAAAVAALVVCGVDRSQALSCALVLHALNFFPYLALGPFLVHDELRAWRRGLRGPRRVPVPVPARPE